MDTSLFKWTLRYIRKTLHYFQRPDFLSSHAIISSGIASSFCILQYLIVNYIRHPISLLATLFYPWLLDLPVHFPVAIPFATIVFH